MELLAPVESGTLDSEVYLKILAAPAPSRLHYSRKLFSVTVGGWVVGCCGVISMVGIRVFSIGIKT